MQLNVKQMAQIALKVVQFKKMFVTTEGQMFLVEQDAIEAVRTKNMIIDDANDHIGIVVLTEDMFTPEKNRGYARDNNKFYELFANAKIPAARKTEKYARKQEKVAPTDPEKVSEIEEAFGLKPASAPTSAAAPASAPASAHSRTQTYKK